MRANILGAGCRKRHAVPIVVLPGRIVTIGVDIVRMTEEAALVEGFASTEINGDAGAC
jgi:hypothetical protein